ncbi:MAG: hypothetical protein EKK40_02150 [Bradyrhizobiaceae bacterium]|nr:MAG: hypothetical protein EKK40_02150 [Bradyrhizobiaceae bacterium]
MSDITYYVALPFTEDEAGEPTAGQAEEFQSPGTAIRRAEVLARAPENIGAVAFSRSGDPMIGEFKDAVVLRSFGQVPGDASALS